MKHRMHKIIAETRPVTLLPINQMYGKYQGDDDPCCIGARLAGFFSTNKQSKSGRYSYIDGIDAFAKKLGGNRAHVLLMLRESGAGKNPISDETWPIPPVEVWDNMAVKFEKLPSLVGTDFKQANFARANLDGSDMRGANLYEIDGQQASFVNANLKGANLMCSRLVGANLRGANLEGANLRGAIFKDVDFTGANCKDADFRTTYFDHSCEWEGGEITSEQLRSTASPMDKEMMFL